MPLKVIYKEQTTVDAGGVLRQFYSDVFSAVEECREEFLNYLKVVQMV